MYDPKTITVCLKEGQAYPIGDSVVIRYPTGYLVRGPGGFNGEPITEFVSHKTLGIGRDVYQSDGSVTRETVIFDVDGA